jgi:hypothetical protein
MAKPLYKTFKCSSYSGDLGGEFGLFLRRNCPLPANLTEFSLITEAVFGTPWTFREFEIHGDGGFYEIEQDYKETCPNDHEYNHSSYFLEFTLGKVKTGGIARAHYGSFEVPLWASSRVSNLNKPGPVRPIVANFASTFKYLAKQELIEIKKLRSKSKSKKEEVSIIDNDLLLKELETLRAENTRLNRQMNVIMNFMNFLAYNKEI